MMHWLLKEDRQHYKCLHSIEDIVPESIHLYSRFPFRIIFMALNQTGM